MNRKISIEITLPQKLDESLAEAAMSNKRSKNDEILFRLVKSFHIERLLPVLQKMKRWMKGQRKRGMQGEDI